MKAVILAAGEGKRLRPLTLTTPKVLLKLNGKSILEHSLNTLNGLVEEAVIIVGHLKEQVRKQIGDGYGDINIRYVEQKELLGTGHALIQAEPFIKKGEEFLILPGDDIFCKEDIRKCSRHKYCILTSTVEHPEQFGVIEVKDDKITAIEEKPEQPNSKLVSTGLWKMDSKILELMKKQQKTKRGEYEITSALAELIKTEKVDYEKAAYWLAINNIQELKKARQFFKNQQ